jgi:hypothetical protein
MIIIVIKPLTFKSTVPSNIEAESTRSGIPDAFPPRPLLPFYVSQHSLTIARKITAMRTFASLIIAIATFAGLNLAASTAPPLEVFCLTNPTNDPAGSPPTSCAQSPIPITSETCFSSCTCDLNGTVSCNGLDSTCTGELLTQACDGYWGCECVAPCLCPDGEPCSTGCGVGLGHPLRVNDEEEPVGSRTNTTPEPIQTQPDADQPADYDLFCPFPPAGINPIPITCGQLNVTFEICSAYQGDSFCSCTTNGTVSCSTSATGCSDEALGEICMQQLGCLCEFAPPCFCPDGQPCDTGCSVGLGHGFPRDVEEQVE